MDLAGENLKIEFLLRIFIEMITFFVGL